MPATAKERVYQTRWERNRAKRPIYRPAKWPMLARFRLPSPGAPPLLDPQSSLPPVGNWIRSATIKLLTNPEHQFPATVSGLALAVSVDGPLERKDLFDMGPGLEPAGRD